MIAARCTTRRAAHHHRTTETVDTMKSILISYPHNFQVRRPAPTPLRVITGPSFGERSVPNSDEMPIIREEYSPGYRPTVVQSYAARSTRIEAAFFTPYLRSDMRLLDVGSGPGSITIGLAELLCDGEVVGAELNPDQVEAARARAQTLGRRNVSFQQASAYELPFPDMSFDAVFAHAVLQHLMDPAAAIGEMRRVLRPGGVIGLRDDDTGSLILAPSSPHMSRAIAVMEAVMRLNGGDPSVGRTYPRLLRLNGFADIQMSATTEFDTPGETTVVRGDLGATLLEQMGDKAVAAGLATADELPELVKVCRSWGREPDAFDAIIWCEAVARRT